MWQACWVRSSPAPIMPGHHAVMTAAAACHTDADLIGDGGPYPFEVALKQHEISEGLLRARCMTAATSLCLGRLSFWNLPKMESTSSDFALQGNAGLPSLGAEHSSRATMATLQDEEWCSHACAELLEKHLQLQQKQVWIECLGVTQKGIFKDTYTILPPTTTVKGKPVPPPHCPQE